MRWLCVALMVCAGSTGAEGLPEFELDALGGDGRWPAFDKGAIQCMFPEAHLEANTVLTRFEDDTAPAIQWMDGEIPVITFEATGPRPVLFSIWTEHPDVVGPFGWQVGQTSLGEVQDMLGTCIRGFTAASDRVVCSTPQAWDTVSSFVFKGIGDDISAAPSGEFSNGWANARLSRIERYRGDAPRFEGNCSAGS